MSIASDWKDNFNNRPRLKMRTFETVLEVDEHGNLRVRHGTSVTSLTIHKTDVVMAAEWMLHVFGEPNDQSQ